MTDTGLGVRLMKTLPFLVDRSRPRQLSEQVANGLTTAIRTGYYAPGERLPSINAMAAELAVGTQTVRKALGELTERGDLVARPREGITVVDSQQSWYTRHVVLLTFGGSSFYFSEKTGRLQAVLAAARVCPTELRMGLYSMAERLRNVQRVLDSHPVDLVVFDGPLLGMEAEMHARALPYVWMPQSPREAPGCALGTIRTQREPALTALLDHLRDAGTRRLGLFFASPDVEAAAMAQAAARRGMAATVLCMRDGAPSGRDLEFQAERAGYERVQALIAAGELPDTLLFLDDYVARGGCTALLAAGLRLPTDVQVAAQVNVGHSPVLPLPLTRLEMDPIADAEVMAALVLELLRDGSQPRHVELTLRFVAGETTRVSRFSH